MSIEQTLRDGNHYIEREEPRAAIPLFMQILQADPQNVAALTGLAKATLQLQDPASAWQMLEMALTYAPNDPDVLNAAGSTQLVLGFPQAASEKFESALVQQPDDTGIKMNLASALCGIGQLDKADSIYRELVTAGVDNATFRYNHSLLLLLQGRLAEGWPGFEARGKAENTGLGQRRMPGKPWDGVECPGESLLVYAEQGLGDNIQFVRYLPALADRVGRVVLEVPEALGEMFSDIRGVDETIILGDKLPECAWHASIMSLPALFKTTEESVPTNIPYLSANTEGISGWKKRIQGDSKGLHVGLVWAGNPAHRRDGERSIPIQTLVPLLSDQADVTFHAFQVGDALEQLNILDTEIEVDVLFPEQQPLGEVASALLGVDLLITVDTALAHLAGALGQSVWLLVTYTPDWRWMLDRVDSPWYPTMRIFRQPSVGNWDAVVKDVREALITKFQSLP